ncbi:GYF domain-containing protein [Myxococcus sp. 1LA]
MAGNSGEDNANPGHPREAAPERPDGGDSPVLDGVSDAELDAIVGQLRTDKNLRVRPSAQPRSREAMLSERLHRGAGRTRASTLGEEAAPPPKEAAPAVKHAWYFVMGGAAYGPHDLAEVKGHLERGAIGPDSLCWREGQGEWLPLQHIPELASALLPPSVSAGPPPVPAEVPGALVPQPPRAVDVSEATTERVILDAQGALPPVAVHAAPAVSGFSGASPEAVAPAVAPEPVTAPAASAFDAQGAAVVDPMPVAQPVGTHAVLTTPSPEERARRKRRLGVLLAGVPVGACRWPWRWASSAGGAAVAPLRPVMR